MTDQLASTVIESQVDNVTKPVDSSGDRAFFRPELMITGIEYRFRFMGRDHWAIKFPDGGIDIYRVRE